MSSNEKLRTKNRRRKAQLRAKQCSYLRKVNKTSYKLAFYWCKKRNKLEWKACFVRNWK